MTIGRRGFTLTEMTIVLGVIGVTLGAIWVAISNVREANRLSIETQDLLSVANNVRQLYSTHQIFSQTTMTWIDPLLPSTIYPAIDPATGAAETRDGMIIKIATPPNSPNATNSQFEICIGNSLPTTYDTCAKLLGYISGLTDAFSPTYLYSDAVGWVANDGTANVTTFPACNYSCYTFNLH